MQIMQRSEIHQVRIRPGRLFWAAPLAALAAAAVNAALYALTAAFEFSHAAYGSRLHKKDASRGSPGGFLAQRAARGAVVSPPSSSSAMVTAPNHSRLLAPAQGKAGGGWR
jgi:hypothetical protein